MKKKQLVKLFYTLPALPLIVVLYVIYSPGLNGVFLLDDIGNLWPMNELREGGSITDWIAFIFGGVGSLGRPLSLFTFAVQYQSWPDVIPFKQFNYVLHIVNFLLVYMLLIVTVRLVRPNWAYDHSVLLAGLGIGLAFFWASAPIQTTAVQYVIQRMTLLAAFWMLLGLNAWVIMLARIEKSGHVVATFMGTTFFVLTCTALGVFSKENAILLPLLCLLYLFVCPGSLQALGRYKVTILLMLLSPIICLLLVLLVKFDHYFFHGFSDRGFSSYERMLTQFEIVPRYILKTIYPVGQSFSLFYDNYPVVKGIFDSWLVIFSFVFFLVVHVLGLLFRKRLPFFFLGIFFYTVGQLLESSFLSLELYFEHRNYLPSVGLLLIAIEGLIRLPKKIQPMMMMSILIVMGVVNSFLTYQESDIWGRPLHQAALWYNENPTSNRAHGHMAVQLVAAGRYAEAADFYSTTVDQFEYDVTKPLLWLEIQCVQGGELGGNKLYRTMLDYANHSAYYKEVKAIIGSIFRQYESGQCSGEVVQDLEDAVRVLIRNKNFDKDRIDLLITLAKINFYQGEIGEAHSFMMEAYRSSDRVDIKLSLAQIEIARRNFNVGALYLAEAVAQCEASRSIGCLKLRDDFEAVNKALSSGEDNNG